MTRRKVVIAITGVPGTGKTRLSDILAKRIGSAEVIHATELVKSRRLFSSFDRDGSRIVRMKELERELGRIVAGSASRVVIIEGHILCDLRIRGAVAVVLREHLDVIKRRLVARGYGKDKVKANLVSEATDYCGAHAERNYARVYEMFSRSRDTLPNMIRIAEGKEVRTREIDLLHELTEIIEKERDFAI